MVTVCHSSTLNSRLLDLISTEQSENVYENKGQVQKVTESYSARPNADRTSSGRRPEGCG
jgi:hypothetical protein